MNLFSILICHLFLWWQSWIFSIISLQCHMIHQKSF